MNNIVKIDILNIGLIIVSLIVAFIIPFELFLFSYAVLGPLHYLTEINWLDNKDFFVKKKSSVIYLVIISILISAPVLLNLFFFEEVGIGFLNLVFSWLKKNITTLLLSSFIFSIFLITFKHKIPILIGLLTSILLSVFLQYFIPKGFIVIGVFLPTLVHVYLFTMLFMIFGTLKTTNIFGLISIFLLISVPFIIYFVPIDSFHYSLSQSTKENLVKSTFHNLNKWVYTIINRSSSNFELTTISAIKIQIFIAFSYTYHYLNWFSKTSVIGWANNITKPKFYIIFVIWLVAILLYFYDYEIGFLALFMLSIMHVILEFPLNWVSIKGIICRFSGNNN